MPGATTTRIDETAFAKINLDLRICGRRDDGYHDLDSLVVFAEIGDHLTFEPGDGLALKIDGPFAEGLPTDDRNLVIRAATALARMVDRDMNARITLKKNLPVASGLGGGSADAAATLRGLCRLWGLTLALADLAPLARRLGADVPVCLGSTSARMQAIGDQLTPIGSSAGSPIILVNPGTPISTPDVFRGLTVHSGARSSGSIDQTSPLQRLPADGVNDLEAPAIRLAPVIGTALDALRAQPGCVFARMSGSGATCFGLFDHSAERDRAVSALSASHPGWWVRGTEIR
ncbi:MAG: 4-(cytidine 5'-diphospho)-2-C-methyl-D-erythritol kinase [Pseudomonadota bacterium]